MAATCCWVSGAVVASMRIKANQILKIQSRLLEQFIRKIHQLPELFVVGCQVHVSVKQRDAAGEVIDDGGQHVVLSHQIFLRALAFADVAPNTIDDLPILHFDS